MGPNARYAGLLLGACAAVASAQPRLDPGDQANKPAEIMPLAASTLLLDIARAGDRLVTVGWRGDILLSDDLGVSWRQAESVPTRTMLTGVFFVDARDGWAVGHDETVLRTTDGGETWQRVYFAPQTQQPLLDLWFADRDHGIAIGAYDTYLTTSDGGLSWTSQKFAALPLAAATSEDEFAPDYHLNHIAAANGKLYMAAEAGHLYRSDDGGRNWRTLPSPYDGSFYGLLPLEGDGLLAFGLRGNLWRSNDAGLTWSQIETHTTAMLTDAVRLADGTIVVSGLSGVLLVRLAGSSGWTLQQQADRKGIAALAPLSDHAVVAVGEAGVKRIVLGERP
ncbi:MAG: hypothetical protein KDI32_05050 [Pseudomonadales bacterium]|nr:hypothetical protein [Pseudomonadales bacterium]